MSKTAARWRNDSRVATLEPNDGSADEEYRWYLALKPCWTLAGYGGQGKHFRNLRDVVRAIKTAEVTKP